MERPRTTLALLDLVPPYSIIGVLNGFGTGEGGKGVTRLECLDYQTLFV